MSGVTTLARVGYVLEKYQDGNPGFVDLLARVKIALETSVMTRVPAECIRRYEGQPREYFNQLKIKQLSDSIDLTAQIQPGMIRRLPPGTAEPPIEYELVDGERRWLAVMLIPPARRPLYKCEIIDADDEVVQFLIAGMANFNREGHQALETADTIERYAKFGIPMQAIADLLGISVGWAYNIKGLLKLPEEVKTMLKPMDKAEASDRKESRPPLPLIAAIQISRLNEPAKQLELANKVVSKSITLGRLRGEVLKVAEMDNIAIRQRSESPMRRWERCQDKMRSIHRFSESLQEVLKDEAVQRIARAHPRERAALQRDLLQARDDMNEMRIALSNL